MTYWIKLWINQGNKHIRKPGILLNFAIDSAIKQLDYYPTKDVVKLLNYFEINPNAFAPSIVQWNKLDLDKIANYPSIVVALHESHLFKLHDIDALTFIVRNNGDVTLLRTLINIGAFWPTDEGGYGAKKAGSFVIDDLVKRTFIRVHQPCKHSTGAS